jgi:hypothetical protein
MNKAERQRTTAVLHPQRRRQSHFPFVLDDDIVRPIPNPATLAQHPDNSGR